jgi:hypothetical protein
MTQPEPIREFRVYHNHLLMRAYPLGVRPRASPDGSLDIVQIQITENGRPVEVVIGHHASGEWHANGTISCGGLFDPSRPADEPRCPGCGGHFL